MKSHPLPSLLSIAAVLVAALVVAIAFGVSTDSHTAQAQADDDATLINITTAAQLNAVRYDSNADGQADATEDDDAYEMAFGLADGASACPDGGCVGYELMADITLSGNWTPIAGYAGTTFDGNGHTISGLVIDSAAQGDFGLFATIGGGTTVSSLGLADVSVTVATTSAATTRAGGLAGTNSGTVSESYVTGSVSVTGGQATVGGLAGESTGTIQASYSTADVEANATTTGAATAGGLAGEASGNITAAYATGDVTATTGTGTATAGGLVGNGNVVITASYTTGRVTATADETGTANEGGLKGTGSDNAVNSFWNSQTSGIATTSATGVPTSTIALQAPTSYGTSTNPADIFVDWNVAIGATTTPQDPWDFGGNWQYPVLQFGDLDPDDQRPDVTLMLSDMSISEGGTATVKATLDMASNQPTQVDLTITEGATLSATSVTVPARSLESGTVTITAADNDAMGDNDDVMVSGMVPQGSSGADQPAAAVTLAITDDDLAAMVENVRVRVRETLAVVTWDALEGADGYTVEWTSRVSRGVASWSRVSSMDVSGTSATVRRLIPGTDYGFRVSASNMEGTTSEAVVATTEGEDDGASPFATMTPTPTHTPAATPIPPTTQVGTSTATTLMSSDGTVTLDLPAGSRSEPYQVNFETVTGCSYAGAKADVSFTCVRALIFDSEDMLETDATFDAAPTIAFHLSAEQVKALGGEFLLTKLHEMGGLMIIGRASADAGAWTALPGTTLTFDDETGGAVLAGWPASVTSFTAVASQATYDTVQEMYGHLLPRDTLVPPTGGPSIPGVALLALLLGAAGLLATGWVLTARRSGA